MDIVELIKYLGILLGGSGITWIFSYRLRKKRLANQVDEEQYETADSMVDRFIGRLKELSEEVTNTIAENTNLHKQISSLTQQNDRLKKEKELLQQELQRFVKTDNHDEPNQ